MNDRSRLCLVLMLLLLLCCSSQGAAEDGAAPAFVPTPLPVYNLRESDSWREFISDKYSKASQAYSIYERLPELREKAITAVKDRLGMQTDDPDRIRFRIRDIGFDAVKLRGIVMAQRITDRAADGSELLVVQFFNEYIMNGMMNPEEEIPHEFSHAVMRDLMDKESYSKVPSWVKEGSAMFCAKQGTERINFVFATTTSKDPEALVNGLDGAHSLEDYPEDYLAFEYIHDNHGMEAIHRIIAGIVGKRPYQEVFAEVLGVPYEEFCATAKAYAVTKVQEWKTNTPGYSDFRKGIELFRNRKYKDAIAELDKAIEVCDEPHILAVARYYAGRSHVIENRLSEAGKYLELVARATGHTIYGDRALYYPTLLLYTATVQNLAEAAPDTLRQIEGNFQAVIRDFPYSGQVHESYYYLGHLYAKTANHKEAAMMFEAYTQAFKNGVYAQASYYNAALNLLELGEKEKALEMARKALKGHSEQVSKQAEELVARLEAEGK